MALRQEGKWKKTVQNNTFRPLEKHKRRYKARTHAPNHYA